MNETTTRGRGCPQRPVINPPGGHVQVTPELFAALHANSGGRRDHNPGCSGHIPAGDHSRDDGDVAEGANQLTRKIVESTIYPGVKGSLVIQSDPSMKTGLFVNGLYKGIVEGDIKASDYGAGFLRRSNLRVVRMNCNPTRISVPTTVMLKDSTSEDVVVTGYFVCVAEKCVQLLDLLNGDYTTEIQCENGVIIRYITANNLRKIVQNSLAAKLRTLARGVVTPVDYLQAITDTFLEYNRDDVVFSMAGLRTVSVEVTFARSAEDDFQAAMTEIRRRNLLERAEITEDAETDRIRITVRMDQYDQMSGRDVQ